MSTTLFPSNPDAEIVSSRIVNFPIDMVYEAWTNPSHLKNWWGPNGFTNTFTEHDLRVGGKWSFIMHGPDKGNYANECEFIKIEKPTLIAWKRHSKPLFKVVAALKKITNPSSPNRNGEAILSGLGLWSGQNIVSDNSKYAESI